MALTPADYDALKQYFGNSTASSTGPSDIAKAILLNAQTTTSKGTGKKGNNEPSLMGRVIDVLSRGNYAAAEFIQTVDENAERDNDENPFAAAFEGLKGKRKTTFQKVLTGPTVGLEKGFGTSALGLGLDIFADPTTYLPIAGPAAKISSLVRRGAKATPESTLAQDILSRGEPIHPESFGLPPKAEQVIPEPLRAKPGLVTDPLPPVDLTPRAGFSTIQPALPGFEGRIPIPEIIPRQVKELPDKAPVGQTYLRFPNFTLPTAKVEKAVDIVDKVAKGDPEAVVRVLSTPKGYVEPRFAKMADEILAGWDNSKSTAKLNQDFPNTLNAKQQVRLYYLAIEKAKKGFKKPHAAVNKPRVESAAYKIYLSMEKTLREQGLVPRIATGEDVSLADVITNLGGSARAREVLDEFSKDLVQGSPTWQAVQASKAQSAVTDVPPVQQILDKVLESRTVTANNPVVTDGKLKDFDDFLKRFSKVAAKDSGVSPAGAKTVIDLTKTALLSSKSRAQIAVAAHAKMLDDIVANGGSTQAINRALTLALEKDLGKLPAWAVNDNKAAEFLMGRVATWWGQADLRPSSLNAIGASSATAAARGKVIVSMFKGFDESSSLEALLVAQGKGVATTPEIEQLSKQISALIENLVGKVNGESVLLRAGLNQDLVNKWMKQYRVGFTFTKGKAFDPMGTPVDYSKGSDWVNSWKSAEITTDPATFLFKFQEAIEQATREKALFDEIGERFGQPVPGGGYTTKIEGYPYLDGYYFPQEIAIQIPRVVKDWSSNAWNSSNKALQLYDRVLSMWKSGVTIYRPAHHIRNMIGDMYLGWMDGVTSLRPYKLAVQVQRSMRGAYTTIQDIDKLVELGMVPKGLETPMPGKAIFRNRSGVPFTAEQIAAVAHQKGLLEHTRTIEDIIDLGEKGGVLNFQPFGGKVQAVARGASELQSHNARLAHFIDKVMKSRGSNLAEIFENAARRSRKWHPTGLDLTDFEKTKLRRLIAFYSWMRKSLPLLAEGLVMNPGKVIIPAKAGEAVQSAQGIETGGREDPFPVDQMFPRWIRSQGIGPIAFPEGALGKFTNQQPPGYVMTGMGLDPLAELVSQIQAPGKTLTSALTPAIKVPLELAAGRESFSQEPITGPEARPGAFSEYVGQQIPIFSAAQSITGTTLTGGETKSATRSDTAGKEALVNWLTGLGIKGTGSYVRQARYEKLAPGKVRKAYDRDRLLAELRNWEEGR